MLFQFFQAYPSGGGRLSSLFQYLTDFGFQDFLLPALLFFTLIFAILQRVPLFQVQVMQKDAQGKWVGKTTTVGTAPNTKIVPVMTGNKRINSMIAIVIALAVTMPHILGYYPPGQDPIDLISGFLPSTAIVLMAVFVVLLLLGLAGASMPSMMQMFIAIGAVILLVFLFLMNMFPYWIPAWDFLRDPAIQALIVVLLTMGLVGWWVIRPEGGEKMEKTMRRWMLTKP